MTLTLTRYAVYAIALAALATIPYLEIGHPVDGLLFTEFGAVERSGIGLLIVSFLLAAGSAWRDRQHRPIWILIATLAACAITRELDMHIEATLGSGGWQVLVTVWLVAAAVYIAPRRVQARQQMAEFMQTAAFGIMLAGGLIAIGFSRMFGRAALWTEVMGESYQRNVKNLAEEGVELAGYGLILLGVVELMFWMARGSRSQGAVEPR